MTTVPNVPCGVESFILLIFFILIIKVPNVPCGVESKTSTVLGLFCLLFVPNVPCGVESFLQ